MQKKILHLVFSISIAASSFAQRDASIGSIDVLADSRVQNLVTLEKSIDEISNPNTISSKLLFLSGVNNETTLPP